MPEVFTIIFFVAWFHDRKVASGVKASSGCFNRQIISQNIHLFSRRYKIEINKKLLAVFSTATCFALPEIYWRKDVISSQL